VKIARREAPSRHYRIQRFALIIQTIRYRALQQRQIVRMILLNDQGTVTQVGAEDPAGKTHASGAISAVARFAVPMEGSRSRFYPRAGEVATSLKDCLPICERRVGRNRGGRVRAILTRTTEEQRSGYRPKEDIMSHSELF